MAAEGKRAFRRSFICGSTISKPVRLRLCGEPFDVGGVACGVVVGAFNPTILFVMTIQKDRRRSTRSGGLRSPVHAVTIDR